MISAMGKQLAVVCAIALGACGEHPSLRVEVVHPDDIDVATTTITVYQSDLFSCAKIELGDLSDDQLLAAEVDQITIGDGLAADDLTMSRVDPKVIVARGYDADGAYVSAGCAEKGVVSEGDSLVIETELTAHVSVNGIGLDTADPFGLAVTVTDPLVRSLPDRVVSWRVHGPAGAMPLDLTNITLGNDSDWEPTQPACTNENGQVRLHPMPPSTVGGFATSVRTSWSAEPPRTFTTFTPVDASGTISIDAIPGTKRWCAARISGATRRLDCVQNVAGEIRAFEYTVTMQGGGATIVESDQQAFSGLGATENVIGVFSVERDATTRDVYAITNRGRPIGLFGPKVPAANVKLSDTNPVIDVGVLPACGGKPAGLLLVVSTLQAREVLELAIDPVQPLGQDPTLTPFFSTAPGDGVEVNNTGCVAELSAGATVLHQVGVIDISGRIAPNPRNATVAAFECGASPTGCVIPMPIARAGVGFLAADDLQPARIAIPTFDVSGAVLAIGVLQSDAQGKLRAVELERTSAASFPLHVVSGQFDADGRPDLFWDILAGNVAVSNFQLSYAHQVDNQRLSALSTAQPDLAVVDTFVADVTGDGLDDLVITADNKLLNPDEHSVRVIPGQVPIANFMPVIDPPCGSP